MKFEETCKALGKITLRTFRDDEIGEGRWAEKRWRAAPSSHYYTSHISGGLSLGDSDDREPVGWGDTAEEAVAALVVTLKNIQKSRVRGAQGQIAASTAELDRLADVFDGLLSEVDG